MKLTKDELRNLFLTGHTIVFKNHGHIKYKLVNNKIEVFNMNNKSDGFMNFESILTHLSHHYFHGKLYIDRSEINEILT